MKRRVVITGLGAVTPIGIGIENYWDGLVNGVCGIDRITRYDVSSFATKIAAEVKGFDAGQYYEQDLDAHEYDQRLQYTLAATEMAIGNSGLSLKGEDWTNTG